MPLTLIGGGTRSGKSSYALQYARQHGERLAFIATAEPFDEEMRARIERHRADRDPVFQTFEEPRDLTKAILKHAPDFDVIVVDCLTLWLTNLMLADELAVNEKCEEWLTAVSACSARLVCVTNEVGCGIVPENDLARRFRDTAGRLNQRCGAVAAEVYWMIFGCPLRVK